MRIGIDATIYYTLNPTGLGVYTANLVNAISKIYEDIVVWTVQDHLLDLPTEKLRMVMQNIRFTGNRLFYLRPVWLNTILPWLIKKEGVDVLFTTVPSAINRSPVPHVVTVHDVIPLTCRDEAPLPVQWNYRYVVPKILHNAAAIIADSVYTKKDVETYYHINPQKIFPVYAGYDQNNFCSKGFFNDEILARYGLKPKTYLLSVGNATPRKNLIKLIQSFYRICHRFPYNLVLAGSKNDNEVLGLKNEIKRLGLDHRVVILDYVPYNELPLLYSAAVLVVYISLYEGFGLPILEAMACGTPVLVSNTTSIPEVAGQAGILVDPSDEAAIADAIMKIVTDPSLQERLIVAGLNRCKDFSWQKTGLGVLSVLKSQV